MSTYKISLETKEELKSLFGNIWKIQDLIKNEETSEEEINLILTELGKYPAFQVFSILENIRKTIVTVSESTNP